MSKAQSGYVQSQQIAHAAAGIRMQQAPSFDAASRETMARAEAALSGAEARLAGEEEAFPDERSFRERIADYQRLAASLTRFRAMEEERREELLGADRGLAGLVERAEAAVVATGPKIRAFAPRILTDSAARAEDGKARTTPTKSIETKTASDRFTTRSKSSGFTSYTSLQRCLSSFER